MKLLFIVPAFTLLLSITKLHATPTTLLIEPHPKMLELNPRAKETREINCSPLWAFQVRVEEVQELLNRKRNSAPSPAINLAQQLIGILRVFITQNIAPDSSSLPTLLTIQQMVKVAQEIPSVDLPRTATYQNHYDSREYRIELIHLIEQIQRKKEQQDRVRPSRAQTTKPTTTSPLSKL
jgi:hypothetical protein